MHQKRNGIDTGRSRQLQSADRDTLVTVANVGPAPLQWHSRLGRAFLSSYGSSGELAGFKMIRGIARSFVIAISTVRRLFDGH